MITKSTVRKLLILEIVLSIIGVVMEQQVLSTMPFGYRDGGEFLIPIGNSDELSTLDLVIGIPVLLLGICAFVGVFRFMRHGRSLYVLFQVLNLLILPFDKPYTATGIGELFGGASMLIAGVVIALLYVTPLKEHFKKKQLADAATGPKGPEVPVATAEARLDLAGEPRPGEARATVPGDEAPNAAQRP